MSAHKLVPALYRHPTKVLFSDIMDVEADLISRFQQKSVPYVGLTKLAAWEYLFLMQHFGVPTRLLDWTENPFIALYFALSGAKKHLTGGQWIFDSDASIWILNPVGWNRWVLQHTSYVGGILTTDDDSAKGYEPGGKLDYINNYPVAIFGTHNSARIVAQKGVFTIFGKAMSPMEHLYKTSTYPPDALVKVVIKKANLPSFYSVLFSLGMTDSVAFPDLDGLAKELKRSAGYEV